MLAPYVPPRRSQGRYLQVRLSWLPVGRGRLGWTDKYGYGASVAAQARTARVPCKGGDVADSCRKAARQPGEDGSVVVEAHGEDDERQDPTKASSFLMGPAAHRDGADRGFELSNGAVSPEDAIVNADVESALAAGVEQVDRLLVELRDNYQPSIADLEFELSRPAASLMGLRDALEFARLELQGRPQGDRVEQWLDMLFGVAREQMRHLIELGYEASIPYLPHMWLPGLHLREAVGREAVSLWWEASGNATRAFLGVCRALVGIVRAEKDDREFEGAWDASLFDDEALFSEADRLKRAGVRIISYRLAGGLLRLVGLQYGLSLVRDGAEPHRVEQGILELLKLFTGARD